MQKNKLSILITVASVIMIASSIKASSFIQLSEKLKSTYQNLVAKKGKVVLPWLGYTDEKPHHHMFYSDQGWFDNAIEIPSNVSRFDIYIPTTEKCGNHIQFTFAPETFLTDGATYSIDVKRILNDLNEYIQCILSSSDKNTIIATAELDKKLSEACIYSIE